MTMYQKRLTKVEAFRLEGGVKIPQWVRIAIKNGLIRVLESANAAVRVEGSSLLATYGDWILSDEEGELHTMNDAAFQKEYRKVGR